MVFNDVGFFGSILKKGFLIKFALAGQDGQNVLHRDPRTRRPFPPRFCIDSIGLAILLSIVLRSWTLRRFFVKTCRQI